MKWFGKSWGAPICALEEHVETPTAACFAECGTPFVEGDQGIVTPYAGGKEDPRREAPFHLNCFLRTLGIEPK